MTFLEIEQALGQRLATLAYPIAWPNKDYDPKGADAVPYVEFRHVPTLRSDDSIDASMPVQTGIVLLTVIVNRDIFANQANVIAQDVADLFFMGLRLAAGSGQVLITKPAEVVTGFVDGVYWRQPVRVNYRTVGMAPVGSPSGEEIGWIDALQELPE